MARRGTTVLVTAALVLLAACGRNPDGEPAPPPVPPASDTRSAPDPVTSPRTRTPRDGRDAVRARWSRPTAVQLDRGSGAYDLVLRGVRVGRHSGFDRIVVDFRGVGVPGWSVQYVERARLDGSGEEVALAGGAFLDIYASHTTWPAPGYYDGPRLLRPDGPAIDDVHVGGTFEGYTQVIAGIRGGARPFRVFTLARPARLVIDVAVSVGG